MEKFVVFGEYCEDAIIKREPFREQHLNRLKKLKDLNNLVTLGPTKCTKYFFGIFNANDENQLKNVNSNPIAVGFGISTPEHVNKVREWGADGVIIGSAFVKRISNSCEKDVVNQVGNFCKEMRLAADKKINVE